ncbi:poly(3-hydroxyalkanoate) depolymerase [Mesorhizobium sp. L-8-3]|uniref:poly(3-hydroxyalkanoate) depolymerase n=1 Tax=Mesorhizobium sp. L-8-3 TaxID=2744522 RepID=UPI0019275174|nr:poly(3-hydroxyalkanoate) depolymerase [Mesorhizobium sp. L-8-3]BCH24479.1 poly(3-hydroxyalkanoic acid) depolymerase [Mesorhizobium sp. L-8-3]
MEIKVFDVDGQLLRTGIRQGTADRPPLLMFNGIGANLELAEPFMNALDDTSGIIFDVPGVGGSPKPALPYRPSTLARMAKRLVEILGYEQVDVSGVSWGGGLAQQFAYQYPGVCRKLILAATAPGVTMVPGAPKVLMKMASPRRYTDPGYMRSIAAEIYGGDFRKDPTLIARHAAAMKAATQYGYMLQLFAMSGWTSLPFLWLLRQPTLILAGTDDPLVPVINARMLHGMIPNSRLELLDDGHLFVVTKPKQSAEMIEAFLRE